MTDKILQLMGEVQAKVEQMDRITQEQIGFLIQSLKECGAAGEEALSRYDEYRKNRGL